METNNTIKAWLEAKPTKTWTLLYDFGGRHYGNTMMNLSEVFNNILRTIHDMPVSATVQCIQPFLM